MSYQKFGKHSIEYVLSQWVIRHIPKDKEITELRLFYICFVLKLFDVSHKNILKDLSKFRVTMNCNKAFYLWHSDIHSLFLSAGMDIRLFDDFNYEVDDNRYEELDYLQPVLNLILNQTDDYMFELSKFIFECVLKPTYKEILTTKLENKEKEYYDLRSSFIDVDKFKGSEDVEITHNEFVKLSKLDIVYDYFKGIRNGSF